MIAVTIAINMSLTLKSTVASFLLGRGAVPRGEFHFENMFLATGSISLPYSVCNDGKFPVYCITVETSDL